MCYLSPTHHHHIWIIKINPGQLQSFKFRCILSKIQYCGLEGRDQALQTTGIECSRRNRTCHSFFTVLRAWICSARLRTAGWFTCILEIQLRSKGERRTLLIKYIHLFLHGPWKAISFCIKALFKAYASFLHNYKERILLKETHSWKGILHVKSSTFGTRRTCIDSLHSYVQQGKKMLCYSCRVPHFWQQRLICKCPVQGNKWLINT